MGEGKGSLQGLIRLFLRTIPTSSVSDLGVTGWEYVTANSPSLYFWGEVWTQIQADAFPFHTFLPFNMQWLNCFWPPGNLTQGGEASPDMAGDSPKITHHSKAPNLRNNWSLESYSWNHCFSEALLGEWIQEKDGVKKDQPVDIHHPQSPRRTCDSTVSTASPPFLWSSR